MALPFPQSCTFAPRLHHHPLYSEGWGDIGFVERSQAWQERREQRLAAMRQQDPDADLRGCTFWWVLGCVLDMRPGTALHHKWCRQRSSAVRQQDLDALPGGLLPGCLDCALDSGSWECCTS